VQAVFKACGDGRRQMIGLRERSAEHACRRAGKGGQR
jgi:hypothetical protein